MKLKNSCGKNFLQLAPQCESRRLLAKNKSKNKVWSKGNFLTASNSFVMKESHPFNQFQMYSQINFFLECNILLAKKQLCPEIWKAKCEQPNLRGRPMAMAIFGQFLWFLSDNASGKRGLGGGPLVQQSLLPLTPHCHLARKHFPLNAIYGVFFLLMEFMEYNRCPEPP